MKAVSLFFYIKYLQNESDRDHESENQIKHMKMNMKINDSRINIFYDEQVIKNIPRQNGFKCSINDIGICMKKLCIALYW